MVSVSNKFVAPVDFRMIDLKESFRGMDMRDFLIMGKDKAVPAKPPRFRANAFKKLSKGLRITIHQTGFQHTFPKIWNFRKGSRE